MEPIERPAGSARMTRVDRDAAARRSGDRPSAPRNHGTAATDPQPRRRAGTRPRPERERSAVEDTPTLADHWSVLRRRRRIIAVCVLLAVAAAAAIMWWSGPTYTGTSAVVIRPIASEAFQETRIEDVGASTEAAIVGSTVVAELAARRLGLSPTEAAALRSHVEVTNPVGTLVLRIAYTGSSPGAAQEGAQAFAEAYLENRRATADRIRSRGLARNGSRLAQLEEDLAAAIDEVNAAPAGSAARVAAEGTRDDILGRITAVTASSVSLERVDTDPGQVIRPAERPGAPSGPSPVVVLIAAGVLGLIVGAAIAFLRDRMDPRISSRRTWRSVAGADPLTVVPAIGTAEPLPALRDADGRAAGALRRLRVAVWPQRGDGPRRIVVTSPTASAAADSVAGNLAITLALAGWSTLLAWTVDPERPGAESHGPSALDDYGAPASPEPTQGAMGIPQLSLLALPATSGRPGALAERLEELSGTHDVEIVVAPALLRSADAVEVSPVSDAMLVVVDVAEERREDLAASLDALDAIAAPLEGVVAYAVPKGW